MGAGIRSFRFGLNGEGRNRLCGRGIEARVDVLYVVVRWRSQIATLEGREMGKVRATRSGSSLIPRERIERRIHLMRGQKVMLSHHLAELYGVAVRELNQAVKRNIERFPSDFMFQLTANESRTLRSQ